jgi:hypothetical protein
MLDKILAGMSLMDEAPHGVRCPLVGFDRLNHQVWPRRTLAGIGCTSDCRCSDAALQGCVRRLICMKCSAYPGILAIPYPSV